MNEGRGTTRDPLMEPCPDCGVLPGGWHDVEQHAEAAMEGRTASTSRGGQMSGQRHAVVCGCGDIKRPMGHAPSDHRQASGDAWLRRARLRAVAYGLAFGVTVAGGSLLALYGVEAVL